MTKKLALAGAALAALCAAPSMAASYVLTYTATNNAAPVSANLFVTTADTLNTVGGYDILDISGDVDGDVITGLIANPNQPNQSTSPDGAFYYDNVLFPDAPQSSNNGILFASATLEYNLFSDNASTFELYSHNDTGYVNNSTGTLDVEAVPEPATWAMFIGGFGLVGSSLRRRKTAVSFA